MQLLTAIAAGVIGQQAPNDPDSEEVSPLLADGLDMFAAYYAPQTAKLMTVAVTTTVAHMPRRARPGNTHST